MRRIAVLLLGSLAIVECRDPTQITVELSTDACGEEIAVDVSGDADGAASSPSLTTRECTGTVVLVPGDHESALLKVTQGRGKSAEACAHPTPGDRSCVVARRRLAYVPHTPLRLPVALTSDCAGVVCDENTTCVRGHCVSANVDPACTSLESCSDAGSVDGGASDAGPNDAGADGGAVTLIHNVAGLHAIVAGNGLVYYAATGVVGYTNPSDGSGQRLGTVPSFTALAATPTAVFDGDPATNALHQLDTNPMNTLNLLGSRPEAPHRLAYDGASTLWVASATDVHTYPTTFNVPTNVISLTPHGLGASSADVCYSVDGPANQGNAVWCHNSGTVADGFVSSVALAVNSSAVFVSHTDGAIRAFTLATLGSTKATTIAVGHAATSMVANDAAVYWMDPNGDVFRYALPGQAATLVASTKTLDCLQGLALDATHLYVIDSTINGIVAYPL